MRKVILPHLEKGRVRYGELASSERDGFNGAFQITGPCGASLTIIASAGDDWASLFPPPAFEHVSVSLRNRCPNWLEMSYVKDLFWAAEECVIQYHPPRSQYVNHHPHCLHLWKPVGVELPLPPSLAVGPKEVA